MKILLKNMEESKVKEMKKYKESIMKENEKIQIIKENLYMEIEDMHSKSATVYIKYLEITERCKNLEQTNEDLRKEIERLNEVKDKIEERRADTQIKLEETQ